MSEIRTPQFPYHTEPRTWLVATGASSIGLGLTRHLLEHGDNVILGAPPTLLEDIASGDVDRPDGERLRRFLQEELEEHEEWKKRCRPAILDFRCGSILLE